MNSSKVKGYRSVALNAIISVFSVLAVLSVFLGLQGKFLWMINPSATQWNDEVFLWKQVQSIDYYGLPKGYFGFNSHAQIGGFGAWSPLLAYAYSILTFAFRGTEASMYIGNVLLMAVSVFLLNTYAWPDSRHRYILSVLPLCFTILARYTLSGMSEPLFYFMTTLVYLGIRRSDHAALSKIGLAALVLSSIMRPYFLIFFVFYYPWGKKQRGKWKILLLAVISLCSYFLISRYFCAAYIRPMIRVTELLNALRSGLIPLLQYLRSNIGITVYYCLSTLSGNIAGISYGLFYALALLGAAYLLAGRKDHRCSSYYKLAYAVYIVAYLAVINLYYVHEGHRHILIFILFIMLATIGELQDAGWLGIGFRKAMIVFSACAAACLNFLFYRSGDNLWKTEDISRYQLPGLRNLQLTDSQLDNTVILEYSVSGEESKLYHALYEVPPGFGINFCFMDQTNLDQLTAGYAIILKTDPQADHLSDRWEIIDENEYAWLCEMK